MGQGSGGLSRRTSLSWKRKQRLNRFPDSDTVVYGGIIVRLANFVKWFLCEMPLPLCTNNPPPRRKHLASGTNWNLAVRFLQTLLWGGYQPPARYHPAEREMFRRIRANFQHFTIQPTAQKPKRGGRLVASPTEAGAKNTPSNNNLWEHRGFTAYCCNPSGRRPLPWRRPGLR